MNEESTLGRSVTIGPPDLAMRAAVDNDWFSDGEETRLLGYGKGRTGSMLAFKDLAESLKSSDENSRVVGVYQDGIPVGLFWVQYMGDRKRSASLHCFIAPEPEASGHSISLALRSLTNCFKRASTASRWSP